MTAWIFARKKPSRWAVLLAGALALACGVGGARGKAQGTAPAFPVRGVVVNRLTGQPIARALVDAGQDATLTDGEGRFELRLNTPEARIAIRRPGFSEKPEETAHDVRVTAEMPELQFSLTPMASLTGHVTLSTGDDAAGIHFTAYRKQVVEGHARWMSAGMAETDSEGAFAFDGVEAPGSYIICNMELNDHFGTPLPGVPIHGYASSCFPGGSDLLSAASVTVLAGEQKEMELTLLRQRFYPVSVTVPNVAVGEGVQIEVFDRSRRPTTAQSRWNAKRGTAEMELPNGSYTLDMHSYGGQQSFGRMEIRVANAPVTGLVLPLVPLHPIAVEVRREFTVLSTPGSGDTLGPFDGQGGGGQIGYGQAGPGVNLSLLPRDSVIEGPVGGGLSPAEGPGMFQLEGTRPGRYLVRADGWDGYVSSITSGGADLARDPLVVGAGGTAPPIAITLRNDWGQIDCDFEAAATDDAPASEVRTAYLYAIPQFATTAPIPQQSLGYSGQFGWGRIPPGTYRVIALDKSQEMNLDDAKEMARWSGLGQVARVSAGGTATVRLKVIRTAELGENP